MLPYIKRSKTSKDFQRLVAQRSNAFNPFAVPNNLAIYDGDVNCDSASWEDTAGGNSITFFNAPTYNAAGLNGHGTILFNGTTQRGTLSLAINYPFTFYIVFRQVSWTNGDYVLSDNNVTPNMEIYQDGTSPNLNLQTPVDFIGNQFFIVNQFKVMTIVNPGSFNDWHFRVNKTSAILYPLGDYNLSGLVLAANQAASLFGNVEFAYMFIRTQRDSTILQDNFITFLMNRFGIV